MKLWVFSDLHRDHGKSHVEIPPEADIAVVAGDICDDDLLIRLGDTLPTVFVAGNHEFYVREYHSRLAELRNLPSSQFYVLENDELVLGDIRFLGCTLWTDYDRGSPRAKHVALHSMNDHRHIRVKEGDNYPIFTPNHAENLHKASRNWLKQRFSEPFSGKTVVLTHHCPSERSVAPKYAGQVLNYAFFSDLDAEIEEWRPAAWIHGHTHHNFDYMLGETRVVCNPGGYGPAENSYFIHDLIIDI